MTDAVSIRVRVGDRDHAVLCSSGMLVDELRYVLGSAFEVDAAQCGPNTPPPAHCCGFFDAKANNSLKVFNTVLYANAACGQLNYAGDVCGFVFPRIEFDMAAITRRG